MNLHLKETLIATAATAILAGAWATMIYAFFCTEDSPAFYGLWYSVGIMITGGIGALAGRIFLRW